MAESQQAGGEVAGEAPRYRSAVGPPHKYDRIAAMQFNILTYLGLREHHRLLDVGCGSLRAGRLFIPYLLPDHYFGLEPQQWLVEEGIRHELGQDAVRIKRPTFSHADDFKLSVFGQDFDFVIANSIFTHAAEHQIRTCLSEVKKVLTSQGTMAATFIPGEENYEGDKWRRGAVKYRPEYMRAMIEEAELDVATLGWPHPNEKQRWLLIRHDGADERARNVTPPAAI